MYQLAFSDDKANKFWRIERQGTEVTLNWGRTGTHGQTQVKSFGDEGEAEQFLQQQLKAKLKKGYAASEGTTAVSDAPAAQPAVKVRAEPVSEPVITNLAFEPAIRWTAKQREKALAPQFVKRGYPLEIVALDPAYDRESAWKKLAPALAADLQEALWQGEDASWVALGAEARRMAQQPMPATLSRELAAVILFLSQDREGLDFVWETLGPQATVLAWAESRHLNLKYEMFKARVMTRRAKAAPLEMDHANAGLWALRLRVETLAASDPDAYAALIACLLPLREQDAGLCLAIDWVCWRERAWLEQDLRHWLTVIETGKQEDEGWESGWVLWPWLQDRELLDRTALRFMSLAKEYTSQYDYFDLLPQYLEPYLIWMVERAGHAAAKSLYAWIASGKRAAIRKKAVQALKLLHSPEVLTIWFDLLKHKDAGKEAHLALSENPLAGAAVLIKGLQQRRSYPEAEQLLAGLLRGMSEADKLILREALGAVAADWLQADDTGSHSLATELPDFFQNPPWHAKSASPLSWPKLDIALPESPAAMDFSQPVIEREQEIRPYIYDKPPLTDQRDAEHLEWLNKNNHLLLSWLDRFSQAKALEIWNALPDSQLNSHDRDPNELNRIAMRFGLDGLPGFLGQLAKYAERYYEAICYFDTPVVVPHLLAGLKLLSVREICRSWFLRHPATALRGLIPLSLNPAWKLQAEAVRLVHSLSAQLKTFPALLESVSTEFSEPAQSAFKTLIARDQLSLLPQKMPKLPAFSKPEQLPSLKLNSGDSLPADCTQTVLMSLLLDSPYLPYQGVAEIRRLCEPASLESFALALWEAWLGDGGSLKQEWAFWALARFGREDAVRQLVPRLEKWPGERSVQRALAGLEILRQIPADTAWPELHRLSRKTRYPSVQDRAGLIIRALIAESAQSADAFGDRVIPTFGLDAQGQRGFDFGVGIWSAQLNQLSKLELKDPDGKRVAKPPAKASADSLKAYKAFAKDLDKQLTFQQQRLEQAMYKGRRWDTVSFEAVCRHPLLRALFAQQVWGAYVPAAERPAQLFRLGPDGEKLDLQGELLSLTPELLIGLPHPLEMMPKLKAWRQAFAELGLTQPFEQLERQTFVPALSELAQTEFESISAVPSGKVLALISNQDWQAPPHSEGLLSKDFGRGWQGTLTLGYHTWALKEYPEADVFAIQLRQPDEYEQPRIDQIHPIAYSELRRDLESLRGV